MAKKKRMVVLAAGLVALFCAAQGAAAGTRNTTTSAPVFPASVDIADTEGTVTTATPASTVTTEILANGSQWSVTAQICGPDHFLVPTAPDCTSLPNRLVSQDGAQIPGAQIAINRGTITQTGVPRGTAVAGTQTHFGAPVVLMSSNNENVLTLYNGVYSVTSGLTITDLQTLGVWKGFWVVTQVT